MTNDLQPGQHLSPDQLSAFTENALPEHERLAALTHLAGCADCRHVVFLAQQADPTAAPAAETLSAETTRRGWFTLPQIFGAAAAAFACSLILALIVHLHQIETPPAPPVATAKLQPPPVPPTPAPAVTIPAHISAATTNSALAAPAAMPAKVPLKPVPQPSLEVSPHRGTLGAMGSGAGVASGHFADSMQSSAASAPSASTYAMLTPQSSAPLGAEAPMPAPRAAAPAESRMRQAEAATYASKSAKDFRSAGTTATPASAGASMDAVTIDGASIQNLPLAGRTNISAAAAMTSPNQLPSRKPAISVLRSAGHTLALDSAGDLFLSRDRGKHWAPVIRQWAGKVVTINLAATPARLYLQQPQQTQTQDKQTYNGNIETNGLPQQQAAIPTAGFELTTADGKVWFSSDGLTWHPR